MYHNQDLDDLRKPEYWLQQTRKALSSGCFHSNQALGVTEAIVFSQHRDSETLDRSNWLCFIKEVEALRGEESGQDDEGAYSDELHWHIERFNHWAVGWVEYLIIQVEDTELFDLCADIHEALYQYPVINEDHYSEMEYNELRDYIDSEIEYLRRSGKLTTRALKTTSTMTHRIIQLTPYLDSVCSIHDLRIEDIEQGLKALGYMYKKA